MNKIKMSFEVDHDTPSEVQRHARDLVLGGLAMQRDQMIADGLTPETSPDLLLVLDMLGALDADS